MSVEPLSPKLTLFELEKTTWPSPTDVVPALMEPGAPAPATDAVIVEPFRPNDTPLLFEKTTVPLLTLLAPADSATPPPPPGHHG